MKNKRKNIISFKLFLLLLFVVGIGLFSLIFFLLPLYSAIIVSILLSLILVVYIVLAISQINNNYYNNFDEYEL